MRTKRAVSSRRKHSLKVKSGGGQFKGVIDKANQNPLILSCPEFADLAKQLADDCYFIKGNVYFEKYGDGTPKVFMDELTVKLLRGRKVYFLAYFSFNECVPKLGGPDGKTVIEKSATNIMDQYMFMCSLASYGIKELNIVLPYFPTGTMERIVGEGELGTGYYLAHLLNSIPCGAYKNVLYVMDMHALCSRFFFHTNIRTVFITMMPKYMEMIKVVTPESGKSAESAKFIVFPDDGAEKRNKDLCKVGGVEFITCSKKRSGDDRTIEITGSTENLDKAILDGKKIEFYIVDDLVQSGGTMGETAKKLVETLHTKYSIITDIKKSTTKHIASKTSLKQKLEGLAASLTPAEVSHTIGELKSDGNICALLENLVTITKSENEKKKNEDITKKLEDASKDLQTLTEFEKDIVKLDENGRLSILPKAPKNKPDFVINYVVTHSILPTQDGINPIDTIIKKVLFFQEYADMVRFNYTTTDSRPYVAKTLTTQQNGSTVSPDSTGIKTNQLDTGKITVLPIADVLHSVLTDIDSPYIAPYIIPNAYPEPVAAAAKL